MVDKEVVRSIGVEPVNVLKPDSGLSGEALTREIKEMQSREFKYFDEKRLYTTESGKEIELSSGDVLHRVAMKISGGEYPDGTSLSEVMGEKLYNFVYRSVDSSGQLVPNQRPTEIQEQLVNMFFIFSQLEGWSDKDRESKINSGGYLLDKYSKALFIDLGSDTVSNFAAEQFRGFSNYEDKLKYLSGLSFLADQSNFRVNGNLEQILGGDIEYNFSHLFEYWRHDSNGIEQEHYDDRVGTMTKYLSGLEKLKNFNGRIDGVVEKVISKLIGVNFNKLVDSLGVKLDKIDSFLGLRNVRDEMFYFCKKYGVDVDYKKIDTAVTLAMGEKFREGRFKEYSKSWYAYDKYRKTRNFHSYSSYYTDVLAFGDLLKSLDLPEGLLESYGYPAYGVFGVISDILGVPTPDGISLGHGEVSEVAFTIFSKLGYGIDELEIMKEGGYIESPRSFITRQFVKLVKDRTAPLKESKTDSKKKKEELVSAPLIRGDFVEIVDFEMLSHGDGYEETGEFVGKNKSNTKREERKGFGIGKVNQLFREARMFMKYDRDNAAKVKIYITRTEEGKSSFDKYYALKLEFGGNMYIVAEGREDTSATYIWVGDIGSDDAWKKDFKLNRLDARKSLNIRNMNHIGGDDIDDHWSRIYTFLMDERKIDKQSPLIEETA